MEHPAHLHDNDNTCCSSSTSRFGVHQNLSEMEFERGIWFAAQNNDLKRVESLLRKGISAAIEDSAGYTALHYAARNGHYEVCKVLLENGADVNALTRSGHATALHRAATQDHSEIVKLLLNKGADPNIGDADGYTALHRAVMADSSNVCRLLIPCTDLRSTDKDGRTALQLAVEKGNRTLVHMIANKDI